MRQFEIHTMTLWGEDLGVMIFENGELAVYSNAKIAQRVADGLNGIKTKFVNVRHHYVVVEVENA